MFDEKITNAVAVLTEAGGPGKTTIVKNLTAALVDMDQSGTEENLVIDLDPQGHLTEILAGEDAYIPDDDQLDLNKLLLDQTKKSNQTNRLTDLNSPNQSNQSNQDDPSIDDLLIYLEKEKFWLLPACAEMLFIERKLAVTPNREHKLKKIILKYGLHKRFARIIIDCPPNLGYLTDNALNTARKVVIPVHAKRKHFHALKLLMSQIESTEHGLDIDIDILAIVPNEFNSQSKRQQRIMSQLEKLPQITPFVIPKRQVIEDAWDEGHTLFSFTPDRHLIKSQKEMKDRFRQLAELVDERMKGERNNE